jgi:hypothetical protein
MARVITFDFIPDTARYPLFSKKVRCCSHSTVEGVVSLLYRKQILSCIWVPTVAYSRCIDAEFQLDEPIPANVHRVLVTMCEDDPESTSESETHLPNTPISEGDER